MTDQPSAETQKHLLVVDDNFELAQTYRELFQTFGYQVSLAKDGPITQVGSGGALLRLSGRAPRLKTRSCTVVSQRISARTAGTGQLQSVAVTKCLPQSGHSWQSIQTFPVMDHT